MRSKMIAIFILCATACVTGCASYAPIAPIGEPEAGAGRTVWLMYYREQFRTYGESTLQPRTEAPDAARQGYTQARAEWKDRAAKMSMAALGFGLLLGVALAARSL